MDLRPTVRTFCEGSEDYSLSIRKGKVVLALANPLDPFQHWIKEEATGGGFSLFNKATAQVIVPSPDVGPVNNQTIELLLIAMPFDSHPDPQAVWTKSKEQEDGFATVFAKYGDEDRQRFLLQPHSRLVYDGNTIILTNHSSPDSHNNWKFVPYPADLPPKTIKIYCRENPNYNLTIRHGSVVFAFCDRADPYQHWRKEVGHCQHLKDEQGFAAFSIVNVATGKAIQHRTSNDYGYAVTLSPFNRTPLDESLLWSGSNQGDGFTQIRVRKHVGVGLDAMFHHEWINVGLQEGMRLGIWPDTASYRTYTHQWKMEEFF